MCNCWCSLQIACLSRYVTAGEALSFFGPRESQQPGPRRGPGPPRRGRTRGWCSRRPAGRRCVAEGPAWRTRDARRGQARDRGPFRGISPGSSRAAWAVSRAGQPAPRRTAQPGLVTHASARTGSSGLPGYRRSALGVPAHRAAPQVRSFPGASPRITSCLVLCDDRGVIAGHRFHLTPWSARGQGGRPAAMASRWTRGSRSCLQGRPIRAVMRCGRSGSWPRL